MDCTLGGKVLVCDTAACRKPLKPSLVGWWLWSLPLRSCWDSWRMLPYHCLFFFSAKTYYLWVLSRYLFFSKDEVYPQSIKPIFGLLIATHLFLRVVLTPLVVKPWVQTCFRKEIHLVRGSRVLTRQITFCSLLNRWREAPRFRLNLSFILWMKSIFWITWAVWSRERERWF